MKITLQFLTFVILAITLSNCSKDSEAPDTEYPVIDNSGSNAFPKQCSEIMRGESFNFRARFSDNKTLGSYSLDIHHNFDHHSHSTEVNNCQMEPVKSASNPFLLIKTFTIDGNVSQHDADTEIIVPADVDPGDYHFLIRVTDAEGWQTIKGVSIRIK